MKTSTIKIVPLSKVEADALQPRRNFDSARLAELVKSIKKHGIMNPLVVEPTKHGTYLLNDGERRYRAATVLKLKEVPVILIEPQSETERLIKQFHLQEQHENWSPLEKAIALARLSQEMKVSINELGEILSLPARTIGQYVAFSHLTTKKEFEKNEIAIRWAQPIVNLRAYVKKRFATILEEEFDKTMEKQFELAIITRIKEGEITKPTELTKLRDVATTDVELIKDFLKNPHLTLDKLFIKSKAQVAMYTRNLATTASYVATYIEKGLPLGLEDSVKLDQKCSASVKRAHQALSKIVSKL